MIIRKLKLHPFAGLTNHSIEFNDGLSVVCGPNEAGKSTTVRALYFILFVKTNLTPVAEKKLISRFLPVTGGDTLNITLEFSSGNENYTITKSWGGRKFSELTLPGGTIINDAEKVQEKLNELLEFNEATYQHVLFTYQSQLGKTFDNLKEKNEAGNSLADLLRSVVMAQGGISSEKLLQSLEEKEKEYFTNWDINTNRPRDNKDIDNPHKKNVKLILQSYYNLRVLEEELIGTKEYEKQVDEAVQKIALAENKLKEKQTFVDSNKDVVKDARNRKNLETYSEKLKIEFENLNKTFSIWPKLETQVSSLTEEKKKIERELKSLTTELNNAIRRDSLKSLAEKYKNASLLNDKSKEVENRIKNQIKVEASDIDFVVNRERKITNNKIRIEAQKLKLNLLAKENVQFQLKQGMGDAQSISLKQDENKNLEIKGSFDLETNALKISVLSGNENIEELQKQIEQWNKELSAHLQKFSVSDLTALQTLLNIFNELEAELKRISLNLNDVLGETAFEELQRQMKEAGEIPLARETILLQGLEAKANAELKSKSDKIVELQSEIDEFIQIFSSHEALSETILEIKQLLKETKATLSNLLPLPAGFNSADEFIETFEGASEEFNRCKEELNNSKVNRIQLDNNKPVNSAEDLISELDIAKKDFERKKKEGAAILKIKEKAEELITGTEAQTYLPLQKAISKYFEEITEQRYHDVLLEGTLPVRIENNNKGFELQQLSKGTLDALALATRLGMAEFYLKNTDGFLILDDPLVDLDEKRQKTAASAIQKFADTKQVIVFTCHGAHAGIIKEDFYTMAST